MRAALVVLGFVATGSLAAPAAAHRPLFVDAGSPAVIADGTVSTAVYGRLERRGQRRAIRVALKPGERLVVELLIPDVAPERTAGAAALPRVTITTPRGRRRLANNLRVRFDEPIARTRYVRLGAMNTSVRGGTYQLEVTGAARSRFCVVVGTREVFGPGDVARLPDTLTRVRRWYRTP